MKPEVEIALRKAKAKLKRVGAAHATGDALALCYATGAAMHFALTEAACFAALRLEPDDRKLALLERWRQDPLQACEDALNALCGPAEPGPRPAAEVVPPPEAFALA